MSKKSDPLTQQRPAPRRASPVLSPIGPTLPDWFQQRRRELGLGRRGRSIQVPVQLDPGRRRRVTLAASACDLSRSDFVRLALGHLITSDADVAAALGRPRIAQPAGRRFYTGSASGVSLSILQVRFTDPEREDLAKLTDHFRVTRRDICWHAIDRLIADTPALARLVEAAEAAGC